VTIYKYVCEETIEERIDAILSDKQALFDHLVDDVSIDLQKHLSATELFGLFGLDAPQPAGASSAPKRHYGGMTGEEFERFLADVLRRLDWSVELTTRSRDGGIDLRAEKVDTTGVPTQLYIQCKNQRAPVSVEIIRELNGILEPNVRGVVASPSGFTADARAFAESRGIPLWDEPHLRKLLDEAGLDGGSMREELSDKG
jgi:hypothetical protein